MGPSLMGQQSVTIAHHQQASEFGRLFMNLALEMTGLNQPCAAGGPQGKECHIQWVGPLWQGFMAPMHCAHWSCYWVLTYIPCAVNTSEIVVLLHKKWVGAETLWQGARWKCAPNVSKWVHSDILGTFTLGTLWQSGCIHIGCTLTFWVHSHWVHSDILGTLWHFGHSDILGAFTLGALSPFGCTLTFWVHSHCTHSTIS